MVDPRELYVVDALIERRGAADVYRARNRESGLLVALKVVRLAEADGDVSSARGGWRRSSSLSFLFSTRAQLMFEVKLLNAVRDCPYIVQLHNAYLRVTSPSPSPSPIAVVARKPTDDDKPKPTRHAHRRARCTWRCSCATRAR